MLDVMRERRKRSLGRLIALFIAISILGIIVAFTQGSADNPFISTIELYANQEM